MNLKKILKDRGLTQKELAKRTGITESAISRYANNNRSPCYANLMKIIEVLNIELEEIK